MSYIEIVGEGRMSWRDFESEAWSRKHKYKKNVIVGFCDVISLDLIINYFACIAASGLPVFLSHPNSKTSPEIFKERIENWKKLGIKSFQGCLNENSDETIDCHNLLFLQLSSGTTNSQKAFGISPSKLLNQVDSYAKVCGFDSDSHVVSWLPIYHDMGLITSLFLPRRFRAATTIIPTFDWLADPASLMKQINKINGTHCWLPNFAFSLLSERVEYELDHSDCLFINCSEPCKQETLEKFRQKFKARTACCYALAENVFAVSQSDPCEKDMNCGKPIEGTEVSFSDLGEILISGNSVVDFVLKDGKFKEIKQPYNTGDIGSLIDGKLFIYGRTKDSIKMLGKQIFLPDVEFEINQNLEIHKGRCVSFECDNKLIILYEADSNVDPQIRKLVSDKFETVCFPLKINDGSLLKTSSGKLCRSKNLDLYNSYTSVLAMCCNKFGMINFETKLKTDGYIDSFSNIELLVDLAKKLKKNVNWQYNFKKVDTLMDFLGVLS